MQPLLFGPIDAVLLPIIQFLLLGLVFVNLITRYLAHRSHVQAAERDGADGITMYMPHMAVNLLLVLASFYYMTVHLHFGTILTVMVVALVITDLFEFESRLVEVRNDRTIKQPLAALVLSLIVFGYSAYIALYFLVEPFVRIIV